MPERPVVFIGVDPGASGGMALLNTDRSDGLEGSEGYLKLFDLGKLTPTEVWDWLESVASVHAGRCVAVIEKVGGYQKGERYTNSAAMFNFGKGVGTLLGFLVAARIPFEEVRPQEWQRAAGVTPRGAAKKSAFKNRLKARAQQMFPGEKITLATCDALLLAAYARAKYG